MKTLNNVISVHRNETFTIDKIIQNLDGSPYIISSDLNNPYLLLTVSSARYNQANRYIQNWWLDLSNYPKFKHTVPINLKLFTTDEEGKTPAFTSFDDVASLDNFIGLYLNGQQIAEMSVNDFVYYLEDDKGNRDYRSWSSSTSSLQTYNCRIVHTFLSSTTSKWIEQTYFYSITLVSGLSMLSYLRELCTSMQIIYTNEQTIQELYDLLLEKGYTFDSDFNINSPIVKFDVVKPILIPTEINVMSDLNGGLHD